MNLFGKNWGVGSTGLILVALLAILYPTECAPKHGHGPGHGPPGEHLGPMSALIDIKDLTCGPFYIPVLSFGPVTEHLYYDYDKGHEEPRPDASPRAYRQTIDDFPFRAQPVMREPVEEGGDGYPIKNIPIIPERRDQPHEQSEEDPEQDRFEQGW